jgi:RNA-directed DNA polymerase
MSQGVRQRVAGVVVNERQIVPRSDYDALKATLHNCVRHGPDGQNRESHPDFRAHLAGRIAHNVSLNPARCERLRALFDRIAW